jgi:Flp pilus assembly protein TadD
MNPEALKVMLKVEAQIARENRTEVEKLYVRATELEPRLATVHFLLASLYEAQSEYDKAIDRYRRILALDPQNALALNNLAYALAERKQLPKDALPYAEKAYRVLPEPFVADTLAWIHHLLGDDRTAAPLIEQAAARLPTAVDVLVHAAAIHAGLNDLVKARKDLDAAVKADPKVADRPDVKNLRDKIK